MSQCPLCLWFYEAGTYHDCNDEAIGSLLENWLTRPMDGRCRFCDKVLDIDKREQRFCDLGCKDRFDRVRAARLAIGGRDLERRGFD